MYRAWGVETGKTYVEADTKEELWRMLALKFPTFVKNQDARGRSGQRVNLRVDKIYPEPIKIMSIKDPF